jgi:enoyl-CoA hydratase
MSAARPSRRSSLPLGGTTRSVLEAALTPGQVTVTPAAADGIARVCIANPGKLNALSVAMWHQLRAAFEGLDPTSTRVVVVHGAGGAFAAGGDIDEFPQFRFDETTLRDFHEHAVAPALHAMYGCDLPVMAQIEGLCIGGGLEIAACCDLRICGQSSRFGIPIARLGFPLAPLEAQLLARVLPPTLLRELLIEARLLDAPEALARGLVNRVLPDADVAAEVQRSALRIAGLSPQALRLNKITLRQLAAGGPSADELRAHYAYAPSHEHREGLAAFIAGRPARFDP